MHIFKYETEYNDNHPESIVVRVRSDTELLDNVVEAFKTYLTHVGYTEAQVNCVQFESIAGDYMWTGDIEKPSEEESTSPY